MRITDKQMDAADDPDLLDGSDSILAISATDEREDR